MIRFCKEVYLTTFTIFFKFCAQNWTPGVNTGKGVAGVGIIQGVMLLSILAWIDVLFRTTLMLNVPKWVILILFFALCAMNHYVLVSCGHGIQLERNFNHFARSKKVLLLAS